LASELFTTLSGGLTFNYLTLSYCCIIVLAPEAPRPFII
jgi:hypothetical protein